jgi:hypothetical protein
MASVFSGNAGRNSAIWTANQLQDQLAQMRELYGNADTQARGELQGGFDQSLAAIMQQYGQQRGDLQQGLASSTDTLRQGEASGIASLQGGYGAALNALGQYYGQGADTLQQAAAGYQPLVDRGLQGYDMYMNALGLNGAGGRDAALGAFQTGPGYQFAVDQATSNAQRAANRLGMAYSGNTVDATTRLANNLANQEYGNWVQGLQGFQGASQNAVAGQAGALSNLASLYQNQANATGTMQANQGKDVASLQSQIAGLIANNQLGTGQNLATAAGNQGANLAQLYTGQGQSQANLTLGNAQNQAGALSQYYGSLIPAGQQGMMAGQQAAGNRFGAIMGGVQMGAQLLGGMAGFGAPGGFAGSMLGNLFK